MTTHENIALWIKKTRYQRGWTQFELARRVGCSESQISRIETGRVLPDSSFARSIFQELGDDRFRQLLELSNEGNPEAAADLWREYGFRFGEEP
jgi:transcriptional regulator with XRE-family HTH domain